MLTENLKDRARELLRSLGRVALLAASRTALIVFALSGTLAVGYVAGMATVLMYGKPIGTAIIETGMKIRLAGVTHVTSISTGVVDQEFVNPEPAEQMREIALNAGKKK